MKQTQVVLFSILDRLTDNKLVFSLTTETDQKRKSLNVRRRTHVFLLPVAALPVCPELSAGRKNAKQSHQRRMHGGGGTGEH